MEKREQTILVLVLAVAAMLLLLLYSPWGSPDLYNNRVYFADNQGVNFDNKNIGSSTMQVGAINEHVGSLSSVENAPKNGDIGDSQNAELNVPDNYGKRKSENKISATKYPEANSKLNHIIAYNRIPKSTVEKRVNNSVVNYESTNSNGGGGGSEMANDAAGTFILNNGSSNSNLAIASNLNGISSTSGDLSLFSDSTVLQATNSPQKASQENIPVPEGWGFLLALAAIYIGVKHKLFLI